MKKREINSLSDLRKEKEKLQLEMEVTRRAFSQKVGTMQNKINQYVLKGILVPAGVAGISALGIKSFLSGNGQEKAAAADTAETKAGLGGDWTELAQKFLNVLIDYYWSNMHEQPTSEKE